MRLEGRAHFPREYGKMKTMKLPWLPWKAAAKTLLVGAALAVLILWLEFTPAGLLGKTVGIGYAVCHRLPTHSPFFGTVQFPLCFRCSGMYLAALITWLWLRFTASQRTGFPRGATAALLGLFFAAWAGDGLNAFLHDFIGRSLYSPDNTLRLITGLGMGIVMGTLLYAVIQQTFWAAGEPEPILDLPRLVGLLFPVAGVGGLMLWRPEALLLPLAVLSTLTVLGMLTLVYTTFAVGLRRRENTARTWWDLRWPLLAGCTVALGQILALDFLRYILTQSWVGVLR